MHRLILHFTPKLPGLSVLMLAQMNIRKQNTRIYSSGLYQPISNSHCEITASSLQGHLRQVWLILVQDSGSKERDMTHGWLQWSRENVSHLRISQICFLPLREKAAVPFLCGYRMHATVLICS